MLGVEADARAFLLTRPYLKRAVRVPVPDPADPDAVLAGLARGTRTASPPPCSAAPRIRPDSEA